MTLIGVGPGREQVIWTEDGEQTIIANASPQARAARTGHLQAVSYLAGRDSSSTAH